MRHLEPQREGFALAAAVMALVLVGALVTGGFYTASQEGRVATSTRFSADAFNIAEYGISEVVGGWTVADYDGIAVGDSRTETGTVTAGGTDVGQYEIEVRRLPGSGRLYLIRSTGEVQRGGRYGGARRTVAQIVRTNNFAIAMDRAVQVYGRIEVGGNAKVDGNDRSPNGWADCSNLGGQAGIVARDTSLVRRRGAASIIGDPPKREEPMDSTDFTNFGDFDYEELTRLASKVFPGGTTISNTAPTLTSDGRCNYADERNWGAPRDPSHKCHFYFPIIHAQGDLKLNSTAAGQGILLVDGDLHVAGGYEFNGIIIVRGKLETGSGNAKLNGTIVVYSEGEIGIDTESDVVGTPIVAFSSCAIDRAVKYNEDISRARPLWQRGWIDLSAAGAEL